MQVILNILKQIILKKKPESQVVDKKGTRMRRGNPHTNLSKWVLLVSEEGNITTQDNQRNTKSLMASGRW